MNELVNENGLMETIRDASHAKEIVLWGTAKMAELIYALLQIHGLHISFLVDSNPQRQSDLFLGKEKIYAPSVLEGHSSEFFVIVASGAFFDEITLNLKKIGYREETDYLNINLVEYSQSLKLAKRMKRYDPESTIYGLNTEKRDYDLTVSFTTYPARIGAAIYVADAMLRQTLKPDRVILVLASDEFASKADLPKDYEQLEKRGLTIVFTENLKAHKKYCYAMMNYPDSVIVTVDDDVFYPETLLETLIASYARHPDAISARRAHRMLFSDGKLLPYKEWEWGSEYTDKPAFDLQPTGVGGVLYPANCFSMCKNLFSDINIMKKLASLSDDVGLKFFALKCRVPVVVAGNRPRHPPIIPGTQINTLWRSNIAGRTEMSIQNYMSLLGFDDNDLQSLILGATNRSEDMPKISVVIPCYNAGRFLTQCLDSVLGQTLQDIEVICVDDGSTDDSLSILEAYREKDARVVVLTQENLHAGVARNNGLAAATGEYVHFLDADDWVEETAYKEWYIIAKDTNADVCVCLFKRFDDKTGEVIKIATVKQEEYITETSFSENPRGFLYGNVAPWNKLCRREFLLKNSIQFDDLICANDRSFFIQILLHSKRITVVKEYWVNNRRNNLVSLTGDTRLKNFDCNFRSFEIIWKLVNSCDVDIKRMVLDITIRDFWTFYHKAIDTEWQETVRSQLRAYLSTMDLTLLGDKIYEYRWFIEYLDLMDTGEFPEMIAQLKAPLINAWQKRQDKPVVFYGAGEGMRRILADLQYFGVPFEFPIWDINADEIGEIEGHKVIKPDFDMHVPEGHVAVVTILAEAVACKVRDQLTELGFLVFMSVEDFLAESKIWALYSGLARLRRPIRGI